MKYTYNMKWYNTSLWMLVLALFTGLTSCVDNDFDEPDGKLEIPADKIVDIGYVMEQYTGSPVTLEGELYVKGTVIADDESGNFYKTLVFQDEVGGLTILLDQNELNAAYPEGNNIYVLLDGLTLSSNGGLLTLGLGLDGSDVLRIPDALVSKYVIAGGKGAVIEPQVVTIDELFKNFNAYQSQLVKLENVELSGAFAGQPYAIFENEEGEPEGINAIIQDCKGDEIILRNSGFSSFVNQLMPTGNGSLVAVASNYRGTLQLLIRDTDDLDMPGDRCDGSGGQAENEITIGSIRTNFKDLGVDKAEEGYITGVVISNQQNGNFNNRNIFFQNGNDGILVRFTGEHSFDIGDQLQITVTGQEVSEYKGLLQLNNVPLISAIKKGEASLPAPRTATVKEILDNHFDYESTRVLIEGAEITGADTYGEFNVVVSDGTGEITLFNKNAPFAGDAIPTGKVNIVAIVSEYDSPQLTLNYKDDVSGGTVVERDVQLLTDFQEETADAPVDIAGWMNIAEEGTRVWNVKEYQGEKYAECEAYQDESPKTLAWLITPEFDTNDYSYINFDSQQAYWKHDGLTIWVSSSFSDVADADWKEITDAVIASENDDFFTNVNSGDVKVSDIVSGKVRVGFRYEGDAAANTTKIRLDNISLVQK